MSILKRFFGGSTPEDDLRIIITRHGERTDLVLGPSWVSKMKRSGKSDRRVSYLPPRAAVDEWSSDPPLTTNGERQSMSVGKKLLQYGYSIDYCYSSPAYRSIQTANRILQSQGRQDVPISIEPGLFECAAWYATAPLSFIPPDQLAMDRHFNVNADYAPFYDSVDVREDEAFYYKRSRELIKSIIKQHQYQGGTILLSGHAGSIEAVTRGMLGRRARPSQLQQEADKVNYCNFVVLQRDARTKRWSVHAPPSPENPYGIQQEIHTSIPLHQATSLYIPTSQLRTNTLTNMPSHQHRPRHRRHPPRTTPHHHHRPHH